MMSTFKIAITCHLKVNRHFQESLCNQTFFVVYYIFNNLLNIIITKILLI